MAEVTPLKTEEFSEARKNAQAEIEANKLKEATKKAEEQQAKEIKTKKTKSKKTKEPKVKKEKVPTMTSQVKELLDKNIELDIIAKQLKITRKRILDIRWNLNKKK